MREHSGVSMVQSVEMSCSSTAVTSQRQRIYRSAPISRTASRKMSKASPNTIQLAGETGLAGCSIEDYSGGDSARIYPLDEAVTRVEAAVVAAHGGANIILTARAENHIRGVDDLSDTIERLRAYEDAGADVVYAPGLADLDAIRRIVDAVNVPVNVLCRPGSPTVSELAAIGVRPHLGRRRFLTSWHSVRSPAPPASGKKKAHTEFWKDAIAGMQAGKQAFD